MKLYGTKIPDRKKVRIHARVKICVTLAVFAAVTLCIVAAAQAQNTFIITDGETSVTLNAYTSDSDEAIEMVGLSLDEADTYSSVKTDGAISICIVRGKTVSVTRGNSSHIITTQAATVDDVLQETGTEMGKYDEINYTLNAPVEDGMKIVITPVEVSYTDVDVALEYDTEYVSNDSMYEGESKCVREGSEGLKKITYECVSINGVKEKFAIHHEDVVSQPVNAIIEYGTKVKETPKSASSAPSTTGSSGQSSSSSLSKASVSSPQSSSPSKGSSVSSSSPSKTNSKSQSSASSGIATAAGGTLTTPSGETLSYSSVLTCRASAYSTELCSSKLTALGTVCCVGSVAVDPSVIPYNSKLYIVGTDGTWYYGRGVANDCGGAITGNSVDLFFDTEAECQHFGIKYAYVYILN